MGCWLEYREPDLCWIRHPSAIVVYCCMDWSCISSHDERTVKMDSCSSPLMFWTQSVSCSLSMTQIMLSMCEPGLPDVWSWIILSCCYHNFDAFLTLCCPYIFNYHSFVHGLPPGDFCTRILYRILLTNWTNYNYFKINDCLNWLHISLWM